MVLICLLGISFLVFLSWFLDLPHVSSQDLGSSLLWFFFLTRYKKNNTCFYNSLPRYLLMKWWYILLFVMLATFPNKEVINCFIFYLFLKILNKLYVVSCRFSQQVQWYRGLLSGCLAGPAWQTATQNLALRLASLTFLPRWSCREGVSHLTRHESIWNDNETPWWIWMILSFSVCG